jgi:hypothetical protein
MKAELLITDDSGQRYAGTCDLSPVLEVGSGIDNLEDSLSPVAKNARPLDFALPARAFVKKYGAAMGGPKKFALLLAKLVGGRIGEPVERAAIEKSWNKMRPLMGGSFNGAYTNRAKENAWVDSPKTGQYVLLPAWTEILG